MNNVPTDTPVTPSDTSMQKPESAADGDDRSDISVDYSEPRPAFFGGTGKRRTDRLEQSKFK